MPGPWSQLKESFIPITSVDKFFEDDYDKPYSQLRYHSLEQSPCYPIMGCKSGGKHILYYCELCTPTHANDSKVASIYVDVIELSIIVYIMILNEIDSAFKSGYKHIILEAPTGIGKSPIGIAVARTLGTSYICVSNKDLQTQYAKDFPWVRVTKGKNNFICAVKEEMALTNVFYVLPQSLQKEMQNSS